MRIVKTGLMLAFVSVGGAATMDTAMAQSSECSKLQGILRERQAIVGRLNGGGKKKVSLTPQVACSALNGLVANGNRALAFIAANKDWCQIPDAFAENIKADNARAATIRNQACSAASKQAAMERKARAMQEQQNAGRGGFGGGDSIVGGGWRIPQGAL